MIKFDAESHKYTDGELVVPSVTQIIEAAFPFPDYVSKAKREYALNLGTAVDLMIEYDLSQNLDVENLGMLEPYYQCWMKARKLAMIQEAKTKVMMKSIKLNFCGTLDLIDHRLFEIKTGREYPQHRLQTAAYLEMWNENNPNYLIHQRFAIYINGEGLDPIIVEHKDKNDFSVFVSCLDIYNFKQSANSKT
jgi:hypothetical protein